MPDSATITQEQRCCYALQTIMHTTMIIEQLLFSKLTFAGECDMPNGVSVDATIIRGVT